MGAALTTGGRLKLLETAFEEGIRHFDTAPLYGQGEAESLLARFLGSKRDAITITTKFGLRPRPIPAVVRPLIPLARAVNRRVVIPVHRRIAQARQQSHGTGPEPAEAVQNQDQIEAKPSHLPSPAIPYTVASLRRELEQSLRKLKTDYIDYYLLHECHDSYLNQPFLAELDALVQEGKIRHYGLGSGRWLSHCILERYPERPWAIQIPDGLTDQDTAWFADHSPCPLFTHSALRLSLEQGEDATRRLVALWAELTDQDPDRPDLLGELLLQAALAKNPTGCVIFSSRHPRRIQTNVESLRRSAAYQPAVAQLLEAVVHMPADHSV
jgi:aryl-alcohol dehydrogenase-like predicted oxidoreductase